MKIYEETSLGRQRFVLDATLAGRRNRKYFSTEIEATRAMREMKADIKRQSILFARYSEATRIEWMMAHELAKEGGFTLVDAVRYYKDGVTAKAEKETGATLGNAVRDYLREKKATVKHRSYVSIESTLERYAASRWNEPLAHESRSLVMEWLQQGGSESGTPWATKTKNGQLTNLKVFFNWCVFEQLLVASPAASIRKFRHTDKELAAKEESKQILTSEEVSRLMAHLRDNEPDMVPRAALLFFAGLRPEREGATITDDEILMEEQLVHVRASRAKDRQNRFIPMTNNLVEWLEWGANNGGKLPVDNWDRRWREARRQFGLIDKGWPHDATRHSFASYHLALYGEDVTRMALGHGDFAMLFQNYRTLVKSADAERYFNICTGCE